MSIAPGSQRTASRPASRQPSLLPAWALYVVFVVYGSLVPLDYQPLSWDAAWQAFGQIHLLDVGAEGRADWVANGVLYLPVGFLTATLLGGRGTAGRLIGVVGASIFVAALALAVEFVQLFFPPRTVSLNDLFAEFIGGGVGAVLAGFAAPWLWGLLAAWGGSVGRLTPRLLQAYVLGYCAFSLFPFDFLLSSDELAEKVASGTWGWLWADNGGGGSVVAEAAKLCAEALAAAPLGWLLATRGWGLRRVLGAGVGLGAVIEIAQFFLVSGVTQGLSVLTRTLGVMAGAMAWKRRGRLDPPVLASRIRRHGLVLMLVYVLTLLAVTGWLQLPWRGLVAASVALEEVHFLPFYYHYFTTEQAALLSLTSVCLMYAPVGVFAWGYFLGPGVAAALAAGLAALLEASKLFLAGLHPDPTNMLLAAVAAWLACRMARAAEGFAHGAGWRGGGMMQGAAEANAAGDCGSDGKEICPGPAGTKGGIVPWSGAGCLALLLVTGCVVGWGVVSFPFHPVLLGLGLVGYGVALWLRPYCLWVVVPAALALLDFAPWSGRFFFDEFDFLLLVSLAVGYVRLAPAPRRRRDRLMGLAMALVGLSWSLAMLRGLLPWQGIDANSFNNYYSPFNALRIAKGAGWALLLVGLAQRHAAADVDVRRLFGGGMVIGLVGTVAVVLWERAVFPGLLNFSDIYRVTGPFSQMHTGGAEIEFYLTMAAPFLVCWFLEQRGWSLRAAGLIALMGASYAVMVTFSRAGYAGFAVALIMAMAAVAGGRDGIGWLRRGAVAAAMLVVVAAVALPVLRGSFAQERLETMSADFKVRAAHWRDALAMRDSGLVTQMFGMGLGRFPETHFWRSTEARAASYRLGKEGGTSFLRLGSGSPLYVEQFVAAQPGLNYTVSVKARSPEAQTQLALSLCEKWLLTSAACVSRTVEVTSGSGWHTLRVDLPSKEVGSAPWFLVRPVKFSINNVGPLGVVEVGQLALVGPDGRELLANGDFSAGLDWWFIAVDVDLPWHIWSLPVAVWFEQGWCGVLALGLFTVVGLYRIAPQAWHGDPAGGAMLAAMLGWVLLGSVDSLVDSPRMLLMLLLVIGLSGQCWPAGQRPASVTP